MYVDLYLTSLRSKRSNFISRLPPKQRTNLNSYLEYLGEVCSAHYTVHIQHTCTFFAAVGKVLFFFLPMAAKKTVGMPRYKAIYISPPPRAIPTNGVLPYSMIECIIYDDMHV